LPGAGLDSVAELVGTALGFTLWIFVGLLLLPSPSRAATFRADEAIARDDETRRAWSETLATLDRMQDDEPERSPGLGSVFHPVPSAERRRRALERRRSARPLAWNLARISLYLSNAGLSLLPRAVHCNVGRPELWVFLPCDG